MQDHYLHQFYLEFFIYYEILQGCYWELRETKQMRSVAGQAPFSHFAKLDFSTAFPDILKLTYWLFKPIIKHVCGIKPIGSETD